MSSSDSYRDRVTEEAALWFARAQDSDFSAAERAEFASWLVASAEHVREYLSLGTITNDVHELAMDLSADELIDLAFKEPHGEKVVPILGPHAIYGIFDEKAEETTVTAPQRWQRKSFWATAATLLVVGVSALFIDFFGPEVYSTGVGEQVSFPLEDGSVIVLNAQSTLEVVYSKNERRVLLIQGEALFDVAKNMTRPFRVITNRAEIEAVGTSFNVRFRGGDTTVTVVEGIVDVRSIIDHEQATGNLSGIGQPKDSSETKPSALLQGFDPVRLTVGRQAKVESGDVAVINADVDKATSWRERRLLFDASPLEDVVAELNLYNEQRIVIEDSGLRGRSISGAFSVDDRLSFTLFLTEAGLAKAQTQSDGTIVLSSPTFK